MHIRKAYLGVMLGAAAALAISSMTTAGATASQLPAAPALSHSGQAAPVSTPTDPADVCFSNETGDTGQALVSQNFEAGLDAYDSMGADDFTLTQDCTIESVDVLGQYFNGPGPATSETVTIYADASGSIGPVITSQTVVGTDTNGSFNIPLQDVPLEEGTYWLSVQINMAYDPAGEWGWENTSNGVGNAAQWQNPQDGFATGCTTWSNMQGCLSAVGPDFMFAINGSSLKYKFIPISKPTKKGYIAKSCGESLSTVPDGTILSSYSDPACKSGKHPYEVTFSTPVEKLSVPATWPSWGAPPNTESSTPDVLYTQAATSVTIDYSFGVKTGGFEAEPKGPGTHPITAAFYSGSGGTGTLLGSITRNIHSHAGARLLGAHCKFLGWGSIVVSSDVSFAIAVVRV